MPFKGQILSFTDLNLVYWFLTQLRYRLGGYKYGNCYTHSSSRYATVSSLFSRKHPRCITDDFHFKQLIPYLGRSYRKSLNLALRVLDSKIYKKSIMYYTIMYLFDPLLRIAYGKFDSLVFHLVYQTCYWCHNHLLMVFT